MPAPPNAASSTSEAPESPERQRSWTDVATAAALVVVSVLAAVFAHLFREGILEIAKHVGGTRDATEAARSLHPLVRFALVFSALMIASTVGRAVQRRHGRQLGIPSVAEAARGEGEGPVLGGTLVRAGATFAATASLASLGREAAIMETGGAIGYEAGRRFRLDASALAAAGIGAAFAAAYHAPVAAVLYVEEHLGVRRRPRAAIATAVGAVVGHLTTIRFLGGHTLFAAPRLNSPTNVLALAAVAVIPAVLASRLFLELRTRFSPAPTERGTSLRPTPRTTAFATIAAAIITIAPQAAGNGMEGIRHTALGTGAALLVALAIGKMLATTAALGSATPGGAFSPSMAVAAGWALLAYAAATRLGIGLPADRWPGVLLAMSVGVAVSLDAPMVAAVIVAEMTGRWAMLPYSVIIVVVALLIDRGVDRALASGRARRAVVRAEDG